MKKIFAFALALTLLAACAPTTAQPANLPAPQVSSKPFLTVFFDISGVLARSFPPAVFTNAYQNVLKANNYRFAAERGLTACQPLSGYDPQAISRRVKIDNSGKVLMIGIVIASSVNPKVTVCATFIASTGVKTAVVTSSVERTSDASAYPSLNDAIAALTTQAVTDVIAAEETR